jgi:hypothetical protein
VIERESDIKIKTAVESIKLGRYGEAFAFLEGIHAQDSINPSLIFLFAYSSIMSGNLPSALSAAERLRVRFSTFKPGKELNAFIQFKSAPERDHAAAVYIDLISSGVETQNARKLLNKIRSEKDFESFQKSLTIKDAISLENAALIEKHERIETGTYHPLKQSRPTKRIPLKPVILTMIVLSLAALLAYLVLFTSIPDQIFVRGVQSKSPVDSADISNERYPLVDKNAKNPLFMYADEESLRRDYENSRSLIKTGSTEPALIILNRIINSNAQYMLRDRARFLIDFIAGMEERSPTEISLQDLSNNPVLYKGLMIKFTSSVVSLKIKDDTAVISTVNLGKGKPSVNADIFAKGKVTVKQGDEIVCTGIFRQIIGSDKRMIVESKEIKVISR